MKPRARSSSSSSLHTSQSSQVNARGAVTQAVAQRRQGLARLGLAWLAMMQVMMFALPGYLRHEAGGQGSLEVLDWAIFLMNWASLTLTIPVILYSAWPIWLGCARAWSERQITMDVPVGISMLAAFIPSVLATFKGSGEVYFDSIAMFVAFLLTARYVEQRATMVHRDAPARAHLVRADLPVRSGGSSQVSENPVSELLEHQPSAQMSLTYFSVPLVTQANRVASVFVMIQVTVAAVIGAVWWVIEPTQAWSVLVSLLVMSCPCALSLAAPLSLAALQMNLASVGTLRTTELEVLLAQTSRITHQNLYGALTWHVLTMPLAALGWVTPWLAALSMLLSSVAVVLNTWRLYRPRHPRLNRAAGTLTPHEHFQA